jgi:hypothetical protein
MNQYYGGISVPMKGMLKARLLFSGLMHRGWNLVEICRRFGGASCLQHHGRRESVKFQTVIKVGVL